MSTDSFKTIVLPGTLPGGLALADVNKQLHAHKVQLDWGGVVSAPPEQLAELLEGLDLAEHADVLGIEGDMSDTTADAIVRFFNEQKKPGKRATKKRVEETYAPQVWTAPDSPVNAEERAAVAPAEPEPPLPEAATSPALPPQRTTQLKVASHYAIRERLENIVVNDLLGPVWGEEEELDVSKVREHYLLGMLAPVRRSDEPDLTDDEMPLEDDERTEEGKMDVGAPLAQSLFPSSFGMTFCVSCEAKALLVRASWGQYERVGSKNIKTKAGDPEKVWRRQTISETSDPLKLVDGATPRWEVHSEFPGVYVEGTVRRQDDEWLVSIFLVNGQDEPERLKDEAWLFQPEMSVESADQTHSDIFVRKPRHLTPRNADPLSYAEEKALRMLYRKHVEFAVGHSVGVHAVKSQNDPTRAVRVTTTVVPKHEVPKVVAPKLQGVELDMKVLAEDPAAPESLLRLPELYDEWIARQEELLEDGKSLLDDYREEAKEVLENCRRTRDRIGDGIRLLLRDPKAAEAFRFMNRAMWQQRVRSIYSEKVRVGERQDISEVDEPKNRTWYPFQLAFILLNLPGVTDLHHSERATGPDAIADLLWFPTGGGKTESYLGLTAYRTSASN